jgi:flagellar hook-basal body complex protein FliE
MAVGRIINPGTFPQINRLDNVVEGTRSGGAAADTGVGKAKGFGDLVSEGIAKVNGAVKDFEAVSDKFSHGERVNIHEMMVKGEQADMNLRLMLSLRNKVVEAYQDVMRLTV